MYNYKRYIQENTNEILAEAAEILSEKLIMFGRGARYGQIVFLSGGAACYPEGTEYFNGKGWVPIEKYKEGDNVLQYDKNTGVANLIKPIEYNVLPTDQFYNIKNRRVDFTTSKNHKHLLISEKTGLLVDKTMEDMFETHNNTNRGNRYKLLTNFTYNGFGIDKSDDEIRLCVALFADGHKLNQENKYRVSFKKERKIVRFRELLNLNNIEYREYTENDYTKFEFYHNQWDKEFEDYWYSCSYEQLKVICSEVILWDGSVVDCSKSGRMPMISFSTTSEKSKDFIQFAFAATGHDVNVHKDIREGRTTCYGVYITNSKGVGISKNLRAETTTEIREVSVSDKMYCFTVPTGYFVVRQNGKIFVSGNSGKGFASSTFMESDKFKVRDVDEWKLSLMKISELKNKYPEIKNLNLKKSDDVAALHMFVKDKKLVDRTLDNLLSDVKPDRLPNIMFDITGKSMKDFEEVIPRLLEVGYDTRNMHLAWILANYQVSYVANLTRERVVPADIYLGTHQGASRTMQSVINSKRLPGGMDGRFVVVLNNRENTIMFGSEETYRGRKVPEQASGVKGFYYLTIKDEGKRFRPEEMWKEELHKQIVDNVPGGQATVDRLRKHALETLDPSDKPKDKQAAAIVRGDAARDWRRNNPMRRKVSSSRRRN